MGTVTNYLTDVAGRGLQEVTVRIKLISPLNPFVLNGSGEVLQVVAVDTDHDGRWSVDLLPSAMFEASTYYLVDETRAPGGSRWAIRVPDGDGPWTLRQLLIEAPPDSGTGPTVPSGTYEHVQSLAAAEWIIDHNLGYHPNVQVLENGLATEPGDSLWWQLRRDPTPDQTILTYGSPVAGRALCS